MSEEIRNLEPKNVWENFYQLTQIPRPSGKEQKIIEFMRKFGNDLGLETIVDETDNVLIKKPATPGMENRKGVVLQAHLDMVPQANSDVQHNFETDPIDAFVDGEWVTARGTTLGADNGMGIAAAMAVLQSKDLQHGPIEVLLTSDEERGMTGAFGLKPGFISGEILMNLDSEDEGELYIGCAGGENANMVFNYTETPFPGDMTAVKINVSGLKGGHSGMDISLGRGNSNKILFRILKHAVKKHGVRLAQVEGGNLRNAIPREAFAVIGVPNGKTEEVHECFPKLVEIIKSELSATEPDLNITLEKTDPPASLIDETTQNNLINAIYACPNGVMRMSDAMPVVETSNNLAVVKSENGKIEVMCLMRSSVDTAKADLAEMMDSVFALAGANTEFSGSYPGWKPNMDSPILKTMKDIYTGQFGKEPEIKVVHAGLECGLLGGVYPHMDMISFGPTIRFPHSPDEKVKTDTVQKFWDFLKETLKNIPTG